jgi:phosphoribosylaminoimidazole-succinocarboxamide synthase
MNAVSTTQFPTLALLRRGKVRDMYDLGDSLLMVATDRISAFDVVMTEPIPGKGKILTGISEYWFKNTAEIVSNHVIATDADLFPESCRPYADTLRGRSMHVRKTTPLPIECVVRGYLAGSGWKEYKSNGMVCGVSLPEGLSESSRLPEPIFTPATKADEGHDENISFERAAEIVGIETAERVRELSIALYVAACKRAEQVGIIIADTKFEFGRTPEGDIILIDEALTPDSSRFWLAEEWQPGRAQMNFDKQVLRDWLELQPWDKQAPAPTLPADIIAKTLDKYSEAYRRLVGSDPTL